MKKTIIALMAVTIIVKITSLIKEIVFSYYYGASNITDAYIISLTIPAVIFALIGAGIATGYIPLYSKIDNEQGKDAAIEFTNNVLNFILLLCTVIVVVVFLFTEPLIFLFASGFRGETLELAILFTRISIVSVYFTGMLYIMDANLQVNDAYKVPQLAVIPMILITTASIALSATYGVYILVYGSVLAVIVQALIVIVYAYKKGYYYKFRVNFKDFYLKRMIVLSIPVIIGSSIYQLNIIIDRTLASQIAVGGISALNYAFKIETFITGLFVVSIVTVMYPSISRMAVVRNFKGMKEALSKSITAISLFVVPATVGVMIFSQPIIKLVFGRGEFGAEAVAMTSISLLFYAVGMIGIGIHSTLVKAFYSLEDTKTPMIISSISVVINIVFNIILSRFLGVGGLALATSIAALTGASLMFYCLRRKIGPLGARQMLVSFAKISFASVIMGISAKLIFEALTLAIHQNIALLLSIAAAAGIYFMVILFTKIDEVSIIAEEIKKKFRKADTAVEQGKI
ncbi:murein biosynthesis integral membrane protein MurJ [Planococcus halotolerans]|uniref:Probable lipid II flippase MurJ n=1 Tax=Planococcus halotolerans TaxID=2233542 RepID=A0A365L2B1_9BACL|nr:murein biosynthesis integral membrane protein MurJ [Planococcus halotolerans]QHJ70651.1 murein biosynthesis integral membrane protein MurJ [Planococcus halotolerans]RAZ79591.1 murein biosynthesis integral membrane protein MurJ [Planococcus halotolerans]